MHPALMPGSGACRGHGVQIGPTCPGNSNAGCCVSAACNESGDCGRTASLPDGQTCALDPELAGAFLNIVRTLAEESIAVANFTLERDVAVNRATFMNLRVIVEDGSPGGIFAARGGHTCGCFRKPLESGPSDRCAR